MRYFQCGILALSATIVVQAAAPSGAAVITYVGSQLDLGDGWRTPSVNKTFDADLNNVYGSLGWTLFHIHSDPGTPPVNYSTTTGQGAGQNIESLPSYITIAPHNPGGGPGSPETGANISYSANYTKIDDPNGGPDIWSGISYKNFASPNELTHLYNMTFSVGVSAGTTYRLGIFVDNTGPIDGSPVALQVAGFGGTLGDSGLQTKTQYTQKNDYFFFDVTGAVAGDVIGIYTKRQSTDTGAVTVGGFTLDAVPEPASMGAIAVIPMLLLRRKR